MGEKHDGREIIERAAQRYISAGLPAERAMEIARSARLRNEAAGDVPRREAADREQVRNNREQTGG